MLPELMLDDKVFGKYWRVAKKKSNKEKQKNEVNEPAGEYRIGTRLSETFENITISTLQQQEDEMRTYSASLSYVQRMAYLYQLNQIAFAHLLENPSEDLWDKNIYID
jgi:hypothetical protein